VKRTGDEDDPGIIRIDFPGFSGEGSLEPISWDEWCRKFDESGLVLLYQEETADGQTSNFNKLVKRETLEEELGKPVEDDQQGEVRRRTQGGRAADR
jgi:hypothetical protein